MIAVYVEEISFVACDHHCVPVFICATQLYAGGRGHSSCRREVSLMRGISQMHDTQCRNQADCFCVTVVKVSLRGTEKKEEKKKPSRCRFRCDIRVTETNR